MPPSQDSTLQIIGRSLIGIEAILQDFRERMVRELGDMWEVFSQPSAVAETARRIIADFEPMLVDHFTDTDLAAWIAGMDTLAKQFPPHVWREFSTGIRSYREPPGIPPNRIALFPFFDEEPRLQFPLIENAANRLFERNVLTKEQWESASQAARDRAFTIAGDLKQETIARVRDAMVTDIIAGTSLDGFRNRIADIVETSPIGPARIETIYRTNVQAAFRDGRETLASDPIVFEVFPYQEYIPIHDGRTRKTHLRLEKLGLNGTGIYRRDDPFWDHWTPPNGFNCRCGTRMLTLEDAARAGVKEAQIWLKSGRLPDRPEWRYQDIPFENEAGFGSRGRTGVLV